MTTMGGVVTRRVRVEAGVRGERVLRLAGLRGLVPGYAQWSWGQRERGLILLGTYVAAMGGSAFAWGTLVGIGLMVYAFAIHAVSTVDAFDQSAFTGAGRGARVVSVWAGLALVFYGPLLAVATMLAWPGLRGGANLDGYLVNCWAYRGAEPKREEWVWYQSSPLGEPRVGRVVAGRGQEVAWSNHTLRVDGKETRVESPFRSLAQPTHLSYRVPEGYVLVDPPIDGQEVSQRPPDGLTIVAREQIFGRAWARFYPLGERALLDLRAN